MIDAEGAFTYTIPTDPRGLVEIALWLRARLYLLTWLLVLTVALLIAVGLWAGSWIVSLAGVVLGAEFVALAGSWLRRRRRDYLERLGTAWVVTVAPGGLRVESELASTTYAWAYFTVWTVRRAQLIAVHSGPRPVYVAIPLSVVPEDEWQRLTTLMYEKLGPAHRPEAVRGSGPGRATPRNPGEVTVLGP